MDVMPYTGFWSKNQIAYTKNIMPTKHRITSYLVMKAYASNVFLSTQAKDFNEKELIDKRDAIQYIQEENIMLTKRRITIHLVIKALVNNIVCIKLYKEL